MRYSHHPLELAEKEVKEGRRKRYRVTTINWTYATERGETNYKKVHRNEYHWTLRQLVRFIRETSEVAEDVIDIRPDGRGGRKSLKPCLFGIGGHPQSF